jgi:hypothetical protein
MRRSARVVLTAIVVAVVMTAPADLLWAQAKRSNGEGPPSPAPPGRPGAAQPPITFDDEGKSGTPCAVPGPCGLCDCPKSPATSPTPDAGGVPEPDRRRPGR